MKITLRSTTEAEEQRKSACMEQLSIDRQNLLMRFPFVGGVIMRMELLPVRDDRLETACTDGSSIFVDVDFYSKLTKEERLFVLAHEVWHCVMLHAMREGRRDHRKFNVATDLEIHFTLAEEHMSEPFVLPHDPKWASLSAEEIYEKLDAFLSEKHPDGAGEKGTGNTKWNGGTSGSFDKHVRQDGEDFPIPEEGSGEEEGGEFVIDKDFSPAPVNENTAEQIRGRVIASAQQTERTRGTLPAHVQQVLERLRDPVLPWQELLKQFVTSCYGGKRRWLPPSRRHVWQGLYLPSMRTESLKAAVAIDTSGSTMGDRDVFFGELVSLMRTFGKFDLTVIQCDAKVHSVEHFSDAKLPAPDHKWNVCGGGGTDFRPVFDYLHEQKICPDLLIFFTDGFGDAPEKAPSYPVMWILTDGGKQPCSWGRTVHMKKDKQ